METLNVSDRRNASSLLLYIIHRIIKPAIARDN